MPKNQYTEETDDETSRRWAREHIERSPDVIFTKEFRAFAYGGLGEPHTLPDREEDWMRKLREEFT